MKRFEGKIVLVTGGSRNTGLDIVEKFVREGARVFTCGSSEASTARGVAALRNALGEGAVAYAAEGGHLPACAGVLAAACDISKADRVGGLFDLIAAEAGRLDVLVNNAAHQGIGKPFVEMPPEYVMEVLGTNVRGGFHVTQQAVTRFFLKQERRGTVVFLSSNTAMRAIRNRVAYCASKGAINSMVRALALDLAPLGVRVNACAPGYIYTERWDALDEKVKARRRANCPLGREARGADIANVVAFLASDDSANMTGEIVTCDAGCSCQHMPKDVDL